AQGNVGRSPESARRVTGAATGGADVGALRRARRGRSGGRARDQYRSAGIAAGPRPAYAARELASTRESEGVAMKPPIATPPMTVARLTELVDAYGARPESWPHAERNAAELLVRESAEAQRVIA